MNVYAKAIVAVLTAAETVLALYPNLSLTQMIAAGVGAFLVYLVPNTPKAPAPEEPQVTP